VSLKDVKTTLRYLENRWDEHLACSLDEPKLLQYRSNLLGSDLRITNFGGGNTSSKTEQIDPLTGKLQEVLWIKGSGGDLGSIKFEGLAALYLQKLKGLEGIYRGAEFEDEIVEMYPLCRFGPNTVAASIDTPLHGFLPFRHIDHLHPDWGIALAAAANGDECMREFNGIFGRHLVWLPWHRPGFELALMLRQAVQKNPGCDGIVLGGHGLFTWGDTQQECYENTITMIDQLGQFIVDHIDKKGAALFGGPQCGSAQNRRDLALDIFPFLRGRVSSAQRLIGCFSDLPEVLRFVNSHEAEPLASLGTSCPDHFIRTKVRPLFVPWETSAGSDLLRDQIDLALQKYRKEYVEYYNSFARQDSPAMRDASPTVVLIPGIGMFSFGKSKTEARLAGEFYLNAIHVMEGATSLAAQRPQSTLPQASPKVPTSEFTTHSNYVALPLSEAFKIEYWSLEEAKIRRQPPEKELSRQVALVVGGGSGIGREVALLAAERGAHVVIADREDAAAKKVADEVRALTGTEGSMSVAMDIRLRDPIRQGLRDVVKAYGGFDILINTAALFPSSPSGEINDKQWGVTLEVNVTGNYLLVDEGARIFRDQNLDASVVLTSSANAVVPKCGSEAYDVSKAALSHLIRELAISLAPKIRVNGISPASVIKGSTMFPRDRVMASLKKYQIPYDNKASDGQLQALLADFYARRTLTSRAIDPRDCAQAILFLAGPKSLCTTGHILPVDGGLIEAFLR
jgi:rhamnose utilization protein RhaD (predicted bifunctional aldolase and dehydrogenase)/NAD(P)-dependent dehydrogenase (short-subunit alcohol dehydrogenase family)